MAPIIKEKPEEPIIEAKPVQQEAKKMICI